MEDVGTSMANDFGQLYAAMADHQDKMAGAPFSIYHKWDMVKGLVTYTSAIPVLAIPEGLSSTIIKGFIPETRVHTVIHNGPYEHLGNAWSAQYTYSRSKKFRSNKRIMPFEVYLNDPEQVNEKELSTAIHFAVK